MRLALRFYHYFEAERSSPLVHRRGAALTNFEEAAIMELNNGAQAREQSELSSHKMGSPAIGGPGAVAAAAGGGGGEGGGGGGDPETGGVAKVPFSVAVSKHTAHRVGADTWYEVGFDIVAAVNTAFIFGYPAFIMAYLGWVAGCIAMVGGGIISFYNNCLLASLHETGGKRHVRYRDLAGHIYGPFMYKATWFIQYFNLSIANIGNVILAGESLKAIARAFSEDQQVKLPGWIAVAGAVMCMFALVVPTLHSLRWFATFSLLLSSIYTFIAMGLSLNDGVRAKEPRDYSVVGTKTERAFNAMGALATIAFAFNTGILPEVQATIRQPSTTNMYKALGFQFTVGTFPILMVTFIGYWAYGNTVNPYLLNSTSGPKSAVTVANVAAFLQNIVCLHMYASPFYEFMDTRFQKKGSHEWSTHSMLVRLVTRTSYMALTTFCGCLFPFFGDFIALTGALAIFPLESGLVHHMYLKVKGKNFGTQQLAWHWSIVIVSAALTLGTTAAGINYIISDSIRYHVFADI